MACDESIDLNRIPLPLKINKRYDEARYEGKYGYRSRQQGPWSRAVLENHILPSLYRSRKHSEKDVSSVVIHCRKFFSHFPHIGFGRITHNASLPDRWLQQVIFTFDQAAQPESSAVLSC